LRFAKMVSPSTGWAVGQDFLGGAIFKTTDGGQTWTFQHTAGGDMGVGQGVDSTDPLHAWMTTGNKVDLTADGGKTWTRQTNPNAGQRLGSVAIDFVDLAHGWVISSGNYALGAG